MPVVFQGYTNVNLKHYFYIKMNMGMLWGRMHNSKLFKVKEEIMKKFLVDSR